MAQSSFVRGPQDYARRLTRFECFLPAGCTEAPTIAGLRPRKPNSGIGVERSSPRDLENYDGPSQGDRFRHAP